jgi:hypothetical protein
MRSDNVNIIRADRAQSDILASIGDLVKEVQHSGENVVSEVKNLRLEISRLHKRQAVIEEGLCPANPGLSALLNDYDEKTRQIEREDNDKYDELQRPTKIRKTETSGASDDAADLEDGTENNSAANVPPGEPAESAIPHGHTTGAAKILEWQAVAAMVGEKMKNRGIDPMERERKRGVICLYGRGEARPEGNGQSLGTEMDSISDYGFDTPRSSSDTYQSPVADSRAEGDARAAVDMRRLPSLNIETVRYLAGIYMRHLNVMHPIITPKSLESMIAKFMESIGGDGAECNNFAIFAGSSDATVSGTDYTSFDQQLGHGLRQRTISEGIVLLILALGKVCERQTKIPDVVPDNDSSSTNSPATYVPPLPSAQYPPGTRNVDVIPGLAYFTAGMEIIGNYIGGTGLQYVHAHLLAGLYYGQLGRVLQSHACIKEAGYTLCIMLKP